MFRFLLLLKLLLFLSFTNNSLSNIEIKYKVNEEIITNLDIENEKRYLVFLRPNLVNLNEKEITQISKNSLIREIIKKEEINKIFKEKKDLEFLNQIKKNLFKFKRVKNEEEFKNLIYRNKIDYDKILEKMKNEALWNELIYRKYSRMVRIDKEKLKQKLIDNLSNNKKFMYNLSELLFEVRNAENLQIKYNNIINYVKEYDFKSASSRFSIASSADKGGQIGWVKETLLSENLNIILNKMSLGEISKPIKYPNGYLILKINDKQEMDQNIDIDKELKELINYETNKQLNQFSLLYFKKLKQNSKINEY